MRFRRARRRSRTEVRGGSRDHDTERPTERGAGDRPDVPVDARHPRYRRRPSTPPRWRGRRAAPRARPGRSPRSRPGRSPRPPASRLAQAELRQGAVPRPAPARPDRPVAAARPGRARPRPRSSSASSRAYLDAARGRRGRSSGTRRIPDEVFHGLAELGAFGMKIDEKYGGLGLSNLHYCQALMLAGSASPAIGALLSAHQSIGVPQPLKLFGTDGAEADVPAPARRRRGLGVPAHRARRRLRPGPAGHHRRAGRAAATGSTG